MNADDKARALTALIKLNSVILNIRADGSIEVIDHETGKVVDGMTNVLEVSLRFSVDGTTVFKPGLDVKAVIRPGDGVVLHGMSANPG